MKNHIEGEGDKEKEGTLRPAHAVITKRSHLLSLRCSQRFVVPALNVIVQIALLSKGETALDADKRFALGMDELVSRKFGFDTEFLRAYVTRVVLFAGMRSYMS